MKKAIALLIVALLVLAVTACGPKSGDAAEPSAASESTAPVSSEPNAPETTAPAETANNSEPKAEDAAAFDESLTDSELIASLSALPTEMPKNLMMETESDAYGMTTKTVTYYSGENLRIESQTEAGTSIMIYNADEGATYQYMQGQTTGTVMYDGEDEDYYDDEDYGDMGMDAEAEDFSAILSDYGDNITARIETLNGEKVIYIEVLTSEEGLNATMKMWYSTKYLVPLKTEMVSGGEVVVSSVVTKIDASKLDDSLFKAPAGVEFTGFSMDDMFDMGDIDMGDYDMGEFDMSDMVGN